MEGCDYKRYHEEYMTMNTGTSCLECTILLSTIPFTVIISSLISSCVRDFQTLIFEFLIIILPVAFSFTVLSDFSHIIFLGVFITSAIVVFSKLDKKAVKNFLNVKIGPKATFVTNYRGATFLFSAFCICAVDFTIFPKRFIKTETFGFGLMDLGVGFFVCSNGLVEKHIVPQIRFVKVIKNVLVLLFLGFIRLLFIKLLDYHEHVSEYGVHWNFFFTLAICRTTSHLLLQLTNNKKTVWLALIIGAAHQGLLNIRLQEWVLSNISRNSFLSANREGVTSCLGYICLYLFSISLGRLIFFSANYKELLIKLIITSFLFWVGALILFEITDVSRRLVNLGYIFWVLALTTTELVLFIATELAVLGIKKYKTCFKTQVPLLFDIINKNSLFFFLFANLLTGLINILFRTLLINKITSLLLVISYMIVLCCATHFLNFKNILKF